MERCCCPQVANTGRKVELAKNRQDDCSQPGLVALLRAHAGVACAGDHHTAVQKEVLPSRKLGESSRARASAPAINGGKNGYHPGQMNGSSQLSISVELM